MSNNEPFTYSNFDKGQPENNAETCTCNLYSDSKSSWNSISCTLHNPHYICEMKANSEFYNLDLTFIFSR